MQYRDARRFSVSFGRQATRKYCKRFAVVCTNAELVPSEIGRYGGWQRATRQHIETDADPEHDVGQDVQLRRGARMTRTIRAANIKW